MIYDDSILSYGDGNVDEEYHKLVSTVLKHGEYKPNRTAADTISYQNYSYKIDVDEDNFPLLTTKEFSDSVLDSLFGELWWYFTGANHINDLQEYTGIWNQWADEDGFLETAYGRFWRYYPQPKDEHKRQGEAWADNDTPWVNENGTVDQIKYIHHMLENNPHSRRIVLTPWNPANATVSRLPPCHHDAVFNVSGDGTLSLHLHQRSGDIGVGVPFNIACYATILIMMAKLTGLDVGHFSHHIDDAHLYCGKGERGEWYGENLTTLQQEWVEEIESRDDHREIKEKILEHAPDEPEGHEHYDHIPQLLDQLTREPYDTPSLVLDEVHYDEFEPEDASIEDYQSHDRIRFNVAE